MHGMEDTNMTAIQRRALALMAEENIGCLIVQGFGWVWPTHVRNDYGLFGEENAIQAAGLIVEKLEAK